MGLSEIVDVARNLAVMVRVHGPDPKGVKMRKHAFHQYQSGKTTLSASGLILPNSLFDSEVAKQAFGENDWSSGLVVTVASVIEPFLLLRHRVQAVEGVAQLIPGAQIDITLEGHSDNVEKLPEESDIRAPCQLPAKLLSLVDVSTSSIALQSMIEASGSVEHSWETGWSLASQESSAKPLTGFIGNQIQCNGAIEESANPSVMAKSCTKLAILGVSLFHENFSRVAVAPPPKRGDFVLAVGSPFGILSPVHFFNSISVGSIANCYPPNSSNRSLLMADIRCLPGMEGGPVFNEHADLVGILIRPLRQKSSGAEVQLLIPWEAIATTCRHLLRKEPKGDRMEVCSIQGNSKSLMKAFSFNSSKTDKPINYGFEEPICAASSKFDKAMSSVCLITAHAGVWASGIVINDQGLILTNAHLLEPWRFRKTSVSGVENGTVSESLFSALEKSKSPKSHQSANDSTLVTEKLVRSSRLYYNGYRSIRVRLDHAEPWTWYDAEVVFVSKGALDVALLQLLNVSRQMTSIVPDFTSPPLGSKAYVIGHGLFGPRCGFLPSVSGGVVAKIVKAKSLTTNLSQMQQHVQEEYPAMLETTAAVHPGASGGLVISSDGYMIGLITSNARHGGGTVIPHLNFSIPCAALAPVFEYARDMQNLSLLDNLDRPDEELSSVWELMPPLTPKPAPHFPDLPESLLENSNKEGKGSRFAKFVSENEMLKSLAQLVKEGKQPNVSLRSKL